MSYDLKDKATVCALDRDSPEFIAYVVTSGCSVKCEFCISDFFVPDLPTDQAMRVIEKISDIRPKMLSFAGKEPFMRKDIFDLVKYTKDLGLPLVIETVGLSLTKRIFEKLFEAGITNEDWISFSVDSMDKTTCKDIGRAYFSRARLEKIVQLCGEYKVNVKVSTVVSEVNKNHIIAIGSSLELHPPTTWKLKQFVPRSAGYNVKNKYDMSEADFKNLVRLTKEGFKSLNIESITREEQDGYCFMIFPNGQIAKPTGPGFQFYGSALDTDMCEVWTKYFSPEKRQVHKANRARTFEGKTK